MSDYLASLREQVTGWIQEGFDSDEAIVDRAVECAEDEGHEDLKAEIVSMVADLSAAHRASQVTWLEATDCDRLDSAFAHLEQSGIVARQHFTCCSNCGHAEIWEEIKEAGVHQEVRGYAFYHMQDTEAAVATGHFCVAYGAVDEGDEAIARIAQEIVDELRAVGLQTKWNGRPDTRISVVDMKWQRRR